MNVRTWNNSPASAEATSTSATTCTGGWTAWTSAWSSVAWDDATTATIKSTQSCYTVAADTGSALDTPLKWDTIIDTYTVAGSGDKAAVVADKKVTVSNTVGLAGSSLLLWLFIILLLGGFVQKFLPGNYQLRQFTGVIMPGIVLGRRMEKREPNRVSMGANRVIMGANRVIIMFQ